MLFCFCLPFGSLILSALIVLWTISSFFNIEKEQFKKGVSNKHFWWLQSFFIYTVISALYSVNKTEAFFNVEVKMSFLLLPFLFFCIKWPIQIIKRCLISFVSGCFFACLALIIRASYYTFLGYSDYFFYTQFSVFIHASYFAMYLILAFAIVILYYPNWFKNNKKLSYLYYFFLLSFAITVFLCSSKLGIISFFISLPLIILNKFQSYLNFKRIVIVIICSLLLVIFAYRLFPESFKRLSSLTNISSSSLDKTSSESTTVRILIWEQSVRIIKNHFWLGTGVGDVNDTLCTAYEQNGLTGALAHRFNAHNQYLQTFIGMGVLGFLILVILTLAYLITGIIKKYFIQFLFFFLIILNFLVESMLQTSAGVLFFVFFFCLFNLISKEELIAEV